MDLGEVLRGWEMHTFSLCPYVVERDHVLSALTKRIRGLITIPTPLLQMHRGLGLNMSFLVGHQYAVHSRDPDRSREGMGGSRGAIGTGQVVSGDGH